MDINSKIIGHVYETYDYDAFKFLMRNREPDHYKQIAESIKKNGCMFSPIIINEKYEIIDGQNTFLAKKMLNEPIQYVIYEGAGVKECITMNSNTKNWTTSNFITSYAKGGLKDYEILDRLEREYSPKLTKRTVRVVCSGNIDFFKPKTFTDGKFKIADTEAELRKKLDFLTLFEISANGKGRTSFLYKILVFCYESDDIDNARLLKQFTNYKDAMPPIIDTVTAANAIEKIYNYNCKTKVYVAHLYQVYADSRAVCRKKEENNE